jgi:hypothetical protein
LTRTPLTGRAYAVVETIVEAFKVGGIQLAILVAVVWGATLYHRSQMKLIDALARTSLPPLPPAAKKVKK